MRGALAAGFALLRRTPRLAALWLLALALPAFVATLPLHLALGPLLDLRPAADRLVTAPASDALWIELVRQHAALAGATLGGVVITLLVTLPLLWALSGFVAVAQLDAARSPGWVAARSIGAALLGVPLRALGWALAALIALQASEAQTLRALLLPGAIALFVYALGSSLCAVLTDYARAFSLLEPAGSLAHAWRRGLGLAKRRLWLTLGLALFELALGALAFAPSVTTRPLGVYSLATGLLAALALAVRSAGSVVGVAAATDAASRSA